MGNAKKTKLKHFSFGKIAQIILPVILIIVILIRFGLLVIQHNQTFFAKGYAKEYPVLKNLYYQSQYATKHNTAVITDDALEAFEAGAFLKGINPILFVHDHPPLGKYFLSVSVALFDNVNTIMLFFYAATLLGLFLIGKRILQNTTFALIPLIFFMFEPSYANFFQFTPLLEPIQFPFILFALYFFMKALSEKRSFYYFILFSLMLGCTVSIRFFALGAVLFAACFFTLILIKPKKKMFTEFLLSLVLVPIILILSYTRTIQLGSSIIHIFGIQKYMLLYHKSQLISPFSFWDLLLFNRWHTWWGDNRILHDSQWVIIWPIAMFSSTLFVIMTLLRKLKINKEELLILFWIFFYCAFLSIGNTSTRYFLPFLPLTYIISVRFFVLIWQNYRRRYEKN